LKKGGNNFSLVSQKDSISKFLHLDKFNKNKAISFFKGSNKSGENKSNLEVNKNIAKNTIQPTVPNQQNQQVAGKPIESAPKEEQESVSSMAQNLSSNIMGTTGLYESKAFNEAVINELMQSRLLEISSMKEKEKTNSLINTLKNELYRGVLDLIRDDPEFRKSFLIGFAQKEFGITASGGIGVGPLAGIGGGRNLADYSLSDLKNEIMEELKKNDGSKYGGSDTVEGIINSVGVESQISSKIVDRTVASIQNFLLNNLKIEGILKKNGANVAYVHLGDNFLNIKEGESLPKKFEGVNWYMKKINDSYITVAYSIFDGKTWKTHDLNIPFKISYVNNGNVPNYFLHSASSQDAVATRRGRSIVLPNQNEGQDQKPNIPDLRSLLGGQSINKGNTNRFPQRGSSSSITRSLGIR
jgi:hypothetical protein